jgi:DNA-binding MarR family transcriptional regulator
MTDALEGVGPAEVAATDEPLRAVGFLLSSLGAAVAAGFRERLAPVTLEPREFAVMRWVGAQAGQSQQALGEKARIPASRMVAVIDRLEERGLLERRQNPDDRRARALFLTERGRQLLGEAIELAIAYERDLCAGLDDAGREQLIDRLTRIAANLGLAPGEHGSSRLSDEDERAFGP